MSRFQTVATENAPKAIGPYSQGIQAGGFLFVSGQLPINPEEGKIIEGDITARAEQVFRNLSAIIAEAGGSLSDVVKVTLFLTDMSDFQKVNQVYGDFFSEPYPSRSAVQVAALPLGSNVEAEAIVYIP